MYGLPQAGILANKLLQKRLEPHGYYKAKHTPGLWRHHTLPVKFTLVIDDFDVEYDGEHNAHHLINALKETYDVSTDWTGGLYCGIKLQWNYAQQYLDTSMPGYVPKNLRKFDNKNPLAHNTHQSFLFQVNTEPRHSNRNHPTKHHVWMKNNASKLNELLVHFYTMEDQLIKRCLMHSATFLQRKQMLPKIQKSKATLS